MLTCVNKWISRTTKCLAYYVCLCYSPPRNMNSIDKDVQDANWKNTRPFIPNIKACKVIKVYDGDTITVATKLHETFPVHRFSVRLSGIDTPELRASNENEKKRAYIAKKYLEDKILNQTVVVEQSLHVKNNHEVYGYCFTPQDGNSILSSISATEHFLYPHSFEDKVQCLGELFFDEI